MAGIDTLYSEIKRLKETYKESVGDRDYADLSEEEKDEANEIHQNILEKEFELQEAKKKMGIYKEPKKGDWTIVNSKWGYKRVRLKQNENCGW